MSRKYLYLFLLSLLSVITFLDRNAISIAGARISSDLDLTPGQFGWILTSFTIAYAVFEIPVGRWGDRKGEKNVLIRIVLWWSLFTALTGFVNGFVSLFFIRFLFGAGEAGAFPNSSIAIRRWFPEETRGRAQSYIWMASRLGGAIAPIIVVPLQMHFNWRITFNLLGLIGVVWVVVWWWLYPSDASLKRESVETEPAANWTVHFRDRSFWCLLAMYYCYACGVFFFISWLPQYLQQGRGITEADLSYPAAFPFFLAAFGCWFGGYISDALVKRIGPLWGRKIVPVVGLTLSGIAMLSAALTENNIMAVVLLAFGMAFMDFTTPVAWVLATDKGKSASGAVTGTMNTIGLFGGIVTSLGIGYLITWTGDYNFTVIIVAIHMFVGAIFALGIKGATDAVGTPT